MNNKIRIITTFMAVLFLGLCSAQAQETKAQTKMRGGRGYFMTGVNMLDLGAFNSQLQSSGYSSFSEDLFALGGGGHAIINHLIIGGEGHALLTSDKDVVLAGRRYKTSLEAGYGFFDLGYQLISHGGFALYPLVGIGGGGLVLKISERASPSFDEVLADPGRGAQLFTGGLMLHASLGADYFIQTRRDESKQGGVMIGIRAGYNFTPIKGDWSLEEFAIAGGPEIGITGPYVRVMLGGGGNRSK
ncbi:MAG: hypothetical protein ONB44_20555 [candidate division KSB1 bacterium]|nr:hypothetical protein [candidate division KSB1 bacterium]MDZ7304523.1 hypothetical protein [candidate division KSB1 bacterium]MDZ7314425.1 hypothetical protein [candidate division KSB1 bacterium]